MSLKASDIRARMARSAAPKELPAPASTPTADDIPAAEIQAEAESSAPRPARARKPVRWTVVLDQVQHRRLRRWALDHDTDAAQVVRAMIRLLDDRDFARQLEDEVTRP